MNRGWRFAEFEGITGFNLKEDWKSEIGELVGNGLGEELESGFRLTRKGLRFADSAAEMFLRA